MKSYCQFDPQFIPKTKTNSNRKIIPLSTQLDEVYYVWAYYGPGKINVFSTKKFFSSHNLPAAFPFHFIALSVTILVYQQNQYIYMNLIFSLNKSQWKDGKSLFQKTPGEECSIKTLHTTTG